MPHQGQVAYTQLPYEGRQVGDLLADSICSKFIELSKLGNIVKKPVDEMSPLELWSVFLRHSSNPKYSGMIEKISDKRKGIEVATEVPISISKNEIERANYRSRLMFERDLMHNMIKSRELGRAEGRAEVRAEGIDEGEQKKARDTAKKMLLKNWPIDEIVEFTGLTQEEVAELRTTE